MPLKHATKLQTWRDQTKKLIKAKTVAHYKRKRQKFAKSLTNE